MQPNQEKGACSRKSRNTDAGWCLRMVHRFKSCHPDYSSKEAVRRNRRTVFSFPGLELRRSQYGSNKPNPGCAVEPRCLNRARHLPPFGSSRRGLWPTLRVRGPSRPVGPTSRPRSPPRPSVRSSWPCRCLRRRCRRRLDPAALRVDSPRRKARTASQSDSPPKATEPAWNTIRFVAEFVTDTPVPKVTLVESAVARRLSECRTQKLLKQAEGTGLVHRWKYGSNQPVRFARIPQTEVAS